MDRGDGPGTIVQRILLADAYCFSKKYKLKGVLSVKNKHYWHRETFYRRISNFFNMSLCGINNKKEAEPGSIIIDAETILIKVQKNIDDFCTLDWKKDVTYRIRESGWSKNLSIHIRRGDVNSKNHPGRYLDDEVYVKIMKKIMKENESFSISLHSQKPFNGDLKQYTKTFGKKLTIHLDSTWKSHNEDDLNKMLDSILKDWKIMINSGILVTSKSSFSYTPALLNINEVHYIPFWHPKLKYWIIEKE